MNRSSVATVRRAESRGASPGASGLAAAGSDLASSTSADLDVAWAHREALVAAAVVLVRAAGHRPGDGACGAAACHRCARGGDPLLWRVADRLADDALAPQVTTPTPLDDALAGFTAALTTAADAIRCCRQTAHSASACWFARPGDGDGCREVLRLLHRLG